MSNTKATYDIWAAHYDVNENKTRDLEAIALQQALEQLPFTNCLEIGCGTGKNTAWLLQQNKKVIAVDFSEKMIEKAREKLHHENLTFVVTDIRQPWTFYTNQQELVLFSLVLEHIEQLELIFCEAAKALVTGGYMYIGELHPFKQYLGSRARVETADGIFTPDCYTHAISAYTAAAFKNGFSLVALKEVGDENAPDTIPRIVQFLFKKN